MAHKASLAGLTAPAVLGLAMLAVSAHHLPAQAQAGSGGNAPDKSGYTLFNPTPTALMRGFSTDRPNKGTSPYTVDAGHFQIETGLLGGIFDGYNRSGVRLGSLYTANPTLKLGVTNFADVEVSLGGYQAVFLRDRKTGRTTNFGGVGDLVVRTKINLLGNDGGPVAVAVAPFYKIPTTTRGLGNSAGEFGVVVPVQVSLPYSVTALVVSEFDLLKNVNDTGRHAAFANLIGFSRPIAPKLTAAIEYASFVQATNIPSQHTLDLALAYLVAPNTQLDTSVNIGLNKAAPDLVGYVGISLRF